MLLPVRMADGRTRRVQDQKPADPTCRPPPHDRPRAPFSAVWGGGGLGKQCARHLTRWGPGV